MTGQFKVHRMMTILFEIMCPSVKVSHSSFVLKHSSHTHTKQQPTRSLSLTKTHSLSHQSTCLTLLLWQWGPFASVALLFFLLFLLLFLSCLPLSIFPQCMCVCVCCSVAISFKHLCTDAKSNEHKSVHQLLLLPIPVTKIDYWQTINKLTTSTYRQQLEEEEEEETILVRECQRAIQTFFFSIFSSFFSVFR